MKKVLIPLVLGIVLAYLALQIYTFSFASSPSVTSSSSGVISPTVKIALPGIPKKLTIGRIGVSASIEEVGLDGEGKMDVPKDTNNAGWFNLGYLPGTKGNSTIAGHYDDRSGAPSIFYDLGKLETGDIIEITDDNNKTWQFKVYDEKEYPYDQFPLNLVFGPSGIPKLNLITCSGTFEQSKKTYLERLVVFSELLPEPDR